MAAKWFLTSWGAVGMVILSTLAVYVILITLTRISGLRSFSKMSAFDFAMTVALGSLFASTISSASVPLLQALAAFAALFGGQVLIATLRRSNVVQKLVDNQPLLLMDGPQILHENLKAARVLESDLHAKLREANVLEYAQVRAVVLESTGDISVLHTGNPEQKLDGALLQNVRRTPRATS